MPRSAPRGCRFAGCCALTHCGVYCYDHKPLVETADDRRPGAARRGYDRQWRRLRLWHLHRYPVCQWAGCHMPAGHVDHIIPLARGGAKSDPQNLQSLCHSHHSLKTCQQDGGFGRRRTPSNIKDAKAANFANLAKGERDGTDGHANQGLGKEHGT